MKTSVGIIFLTALLLSVAASQPPSPSATTTTTAQATTNESVGTIVEITPGTTLLLNTGTGDPVHYKFSKTVSYTNAKGKEINPTKLKKDRKIHVHYTKEGNDLVVDKLTIVKE
jgi:hypothetical protein